MNARSSLLVSMVLLLVLPGCHDGPGVDDAGDDDETGGIIGDGDGDGDGDGERFDLGTPDTGEGEGEEECAAVKVDTTMVPPTVVLLVDQSGSMTDDFAGQSRWEAVYETLMDPQDGVVKPLEDRIRFGLALYTSEDGFEGGECPMLTRVDPALSNHAQLDGVYAPKKPIRDTPTGESLQAVAGDLAELDVDGPKAVVLATDGEPDTCEQPNPQHGQAESLAAAQAAFDLDIRTYIISVGNEVSDQHLQEMANAGVGLDPQGNDKAPFYKAFDADELLNAFDDIIGSVVSCEYDVNGIVDLQTQCEGTVALDGKILDCGVDWKMADASTLELMGGACQTLKDGDEHELEASWPCGSVEIP